MSERHVLTTLSFSLTQRELVLCKFHQSRTALISGPGLQRAWWFSRQWPKAVRSGCAGLGRASISGFWLLWGYSAWLRSRPWRGEKRLGSQQLLGFLTPFSLPGSRWLRWGKVYWQDVNSEWRPDPAGTGSSLLLSPLRAAAGPQPCLARAAPRERAWPSARREPGPLATFSGQKKKRAFPGVYLILTCVATEGNLAL